MNEKDQFDLKYWGSDYFYAYQNEKQPKRSVRKKLLIVFCFVGILALLPMAMIGLTDLNTNKVKKVSVAPKLEPIEKKRTVNQNTESITPKSTITEVINNDSYWKISKRVCGTGINYLSVRDQNNGKALYKGDFVTVNCTL